MTDSEQRPPLSVGECVYTAVGLAVLGLQQLQVVRRDLEQRWREAMEPAAQPPAETSGSGQP